MSDLFPAWKRSQIMARIRSRDTKSELLVRRFLFRHGLRFRKNDKRLPGRPDIVLPKYRTVIFLNGCFWHGHEPCSLYRIPQSNRTFWQHKIAHNRQRDEKVVAKLLSLGWRTIVVWECELRKKERRQETLEGLLNEIWDE